MDDRVDLLLPGLVTQDADLESEFEALLAETSTLAFRVAYGVLPHQHDAEDVAQESFAKAYRHFGRLRDRTRFSGVAGADDMADGARPPALESTSRHTRDGGGRRVARRRRAGRRPCRQAARDRAAALWAAIDTLPEKLRLVVVLSGIEGHDHREVAALLRIPEGT